MDKETEDLKRRVAELERRERERTRWQPRSGSVAPVWYLSPSGGIPARDTVTGQFGSALCQRYYIKEVDNEYYFEPSSPAVFDRVYNEFKSDVAEGEYIRATRHGGALLVDIEDCL